MLSKEWLQGCKMMADAGVMFQSDAVKSLLGHIAELEENATAQAIALKKAEADCSHWKANHENQVLRARILMERPDMPIERVKAYRRMQELEALSDELFNTLNFERGSRVDLQRDAGRYRGLRNSSMEERNRLEHYASKALDDAIDQAMRNL